MSCSCARSTHGVDVFVSGPRRRAEELAILNRKVQWVKEGIRLAPDQRHTAEVIEELGLGASKPVDTLVCTTARETTEDEKEPLEGAAASRFRSLAAKLNNLSFDRADIRFGTVCSVASKHRVGDTIWLLSIARFFVRKAALVDLLLVVHVRKPPERVHGCGR